jgi:hypothetical protein
VADESPGHQNFSPESLRGSTARFILVVANPEAVFAQAIAAYEESGRPHLIANTQIAPPSGTSGKLPGRSALS